MPRNLKPSELEAKAGWIAAAAENLSRDVRQVLKNLKDWSAEASGGSSGPSPKNQVSRPTEAAALATDQFTVDRDRFIEQLVMADQCLRELERIRRKVMAPPPPAHPVERGLAKCCNPRGCDAWATKAGRCDACYQYRWRHDRDRVVDTDAPG